MSADFSESENRARVLCTTFAPIPGPNGISGRLLERLPSLVLDYEVDIVGLRSGEQPHLEKFAGCKVFRVTALDEDYQTAANTFKRAVQRLLEGGDYQLVHFADPFSGTILLDGRHDFNYRVIFEVTSMPSWDLRERPWMLARKARARAFIEALRLDERRCLREADEVLTSTEVTRQLLIKRGAQPANTHVLAGGGVLGEFRENIKRDEPPLFLVLARLAPWYDFGTLVRATKLVVAKQPCQVMVAGPGDEKVGPRLRAAIAKEKLDQEFTLLPAVPYEEVPELLQRATVGLVPLAPTKRAMEGGVVPRKLYEYFAAALPVIAADTPAIREITRKNEAALLYRPGDERGLAKAMLRLLEDRAERHRLGHAALRLHREAYHPQRCAYQLRQIYQAVINRLPVVLTEPAAITESYEANAPGEEPRLRYLAPEVAQITKKAGEPSLVIKIGELAALRPAVRAEGALAETALNPPSADTISKQTKLNPQRESVDEARAQRLRMMDNPEVKAQFENAEVTREYVGKAQKRRQPLIKDLTRPPEAEAPPKDESEDTKA